MGALHLIGIIAALLAMGVIGIVAASIEANRAIQKAAETGRPIVIHGVSYTVTKG